MPLFYISIIVLQELFYNHFLYRKYQIVSPEAITISPMANI